MGEPLIVLWPGDRSNDLGNADPLLGPVKLNPNKPSGSHRLDSPGTPPDSPSSLLPKKSANAIPRGRDTNEQEVVPG